MSYSNVRIPPDSTGKRISHNCFIELDFNNLVGDISINDVVTGSVSGRIGLVINYTLEGANYGELYIALEHETSITTLSDTESLTFNGSFGSSTANVVGTGTIFYTQNMVSVGGNNPFYHQNIDQNGASYIRSYEGANKFNSFGNSISAISNIIGVYDFSQYNSSDLYTVNNNNGGTSEFKSKYGLYELKTTVDNGSSSMITTNKYHFYWPGNGLTSYHSGTLSDNGIVGNVREWGYYDDYRGTFFKLSGTTLYCVLRNTLNDVTTDINILQDDWNVDKLNGTGLSGYKLFLDTHVIYWSDYNNGVRFGVVNSNGERIICHQILTDDNTHYPLISNYSLPMRAKNYNTQLVQNEATIKIKKQFVVSEGNIDYTYWRNVYKSDEKTISGSTIPVLSIRSKQIFDGNVNNINVYPISINGNVDGGRVRIDLYWPCELVGDTWNLDNGGSLEGDDTSNSIVLSGSTLFHSYYINNDAFNIELENVFEKNDEALLLNADGVTAPSLTLTATKLGSNNSNVEFSVQYKELY